MHYPSFAARSEQGPSDLKIGVAFASQPSPDEARANLASPVQCSATTPSRSTSARPLVDGHGRRFSRWARSARLVESWRRGMLLRPPRPTTAHQTCWEAPAAWPAWPARPTNTLSPHPRLRVPLCRAVFRPGLRQFFAHPGSCLSDRPANLYLSSCEALTPPSSAP